MNVFYRGGLKHQMELKIKLAEYEKEYAELVRQIRGLDEQKQKLLVHGIGLENKIELLKEQVKEQETPVEVKDEAQS